MNYRIFLASCALAVLAACAGTPPANQTHVVAASVSTGSHIPGAMTGTVSTSNTSIITQAPSGAKGGS